jgi:hypothetical protein
MRKATSTDEPNDAMAEEQMSRAQEETIALTSMQ